MTAQVDESTLHCIVCPTTKQPLELCSRAEAEKRMGGELHLLRTNRKEEQKRYETVVLAEDRTVAYPVIDGIPVLLAPEALGPITDCRELDLGDPKYAEAYEEMDFYNDVASREADNVTDTDAFRFLQSLARAPAEALDSFPHPRQLWLDAIYDSAAQWNAYDYFAPVKNKVVMQLGGKGIHVTKFLLGGAAEAWLVTPMLGEARFAMALARAFGVDKRLRTVVGIAEEIPLADGWMDVIYSGACLHHMVTDLALPEIARILRRGGKFGAADPWRAPLYGIGTKIFGKREPSVYCRPLTRERLAPVEKHFQEHDLVQHGAVTRYPLLALKKLGISLGMNTVWRINKLDDFLSSCIPGLRRWGSSIATLGTR